ncbi:hypothetical protein E1262_22380 [Jiangella aurantiaca]|uniref:Uncharacterized protein n=1 Tax=Jiangella aurantiaca TaxID=2530373 RepID=A0A4R5A3D0_9ACTN|nr:hypothetical protein [Jiangella aurantiaca]TDD66353.1 hypothetical protein E1262_22380 [Jiangella aurantiaca]
MDSAGLPADDRQARLTLAAAVVSQRGEVPEDVLDRDSQVARMMLELSDWIAAAVVLARGGPGTVVDQDSLSKEIVAFDLDQADDDLLDVDVDVEDEDEDEWFDDESLEDAALTVSLGLFAAVLVWRVLGAIDEDDRLTRLGWWGVPESFLHAWQPRDESA